ncbi:MAG: DUF1080 domain-containing protein [Opitutae bacterium]
MNSTAIKLLAALALLFVLGCQRQITLFDGKNLDNWERTDFAGKGDVRIDENGSLVLEMGAELSGVRWKGKTDLPKIDYEVTLQAKRTMGSDFFCGLTFPFKESHATLILGGWGGSLIGISSLDDFDASENETGDAYVFEDKKWYDVRLRVTEEKLQVWLDDKMVIDTDVEGRKVSMRFGEIEMSVPFGICTYATTGVIRDVKIRKL